MTSVREGVADASETRWTLPILLLTVFLSLIGFGVVIPLLPFYAHVFDAPAWQVTLMFSAFSAGQFGGELTWGRLSDRIGRRPVLLFTILISTLGYVALAFAPGLWAAIAIRLVSGFFSGNISVIQGYIADITPPEQRANRLGLIGGAFGLGFVVGPSLGGLLARPELGAAGFQPPLLAAAALCLCAGLGILFFVRESLPAHRRDTRRGGPFDALGEVLADSVLKRLLASTLVSFSAFSAMQSTQGLWAEARFGWGPHELGLFSAFSGGIMAVCQMFLVGRWVRRAGEVNTMTAGLLMTATAFVIMAFTPGAGLAILGIAIVSVGFPSVQPSATALISRTTSLDRQGAVMGVNAAAGAMARIAGPVAGGLLFSEIGAYAPFLFASLGLVPAALLAQGAGRALRRRD